MRKLGTATGVFTAGKALDLCTEFGWCRSRCASFAAAQVLGGEAAACSSAPSARPVAWGTPVHPLPCAASSKADPGAGPGESADRGSGNPAVAAGAVQALGCMGLPLQGSHRGTFQVGPRWREAEGSAAGGSGSRAGSGAGGGAGKEELGGSQPGGDGGRGAGGRGGARGGRPTSCAGASRRRHSGADVRSLLYLCRVVHATACARECDSQE